MSTDSSHTLLATRLNSEPSIFRGCSSTELVALLVVACVVWLPAGFLASALLGRLPMGLGIAVVGVLGTVVAGASLFRRIKRGRPESYYQQRAVVWLDDLGLRRCGAIRRGGIWDLGRTL